MERKKSRMNEERGLFLYAAYLYESEHGKGSRSVKDGYVARAKCLATVLKRDYEVDRKRTHMVIALLSHKEIVSVYFGKRRWQRRQAA